MVVTKNEDGTYKITKENPTEQDLSKEELESRKASLEANIAANQAEIDSIDEILTAITALEA